MLILSYEDTQRMISGSIVMYEGRLIYVNRVDAECVMDAVDCETGERFKALADFHIIDNPNTNRIGYLNIQGKDAEYTVRQPVRAYRMGFNRDNLMAIRKGIIARPLIQHMGLRMEALFESYHNIYPTFEEALKMSQDLRRTIAYDRSFAIMPTGAVLYQSLLAGEVRGAHEDSVRWKPMNNHPQFHRERQALKWEA